MSLSLENVRVYTQSAIRIEGARGTVVYLDPFALTDAEADAVVKDVLAALDKELGAVIR